MTDHLDLTDRQRIHCLGLEARVHELRTQLADAERPSPQAIREAYERGRLDARVALEHLASDLRSLADRIDEATQQTRREYVSGRAEAESAIRILGDDD